MSSRINITIDDDLLKRIDEYAENNSLTRSAFIALSCTKYIETESKLPIAKDLLSSFFALTGSAFKGEISPADYSNRINDLQSEISLLK